MTTRIILLVLAVVAIAGAGLWLLGPREPVETTIRFDPSSIGDDPDAYLAREEADVPNLKPEAAKEIVWAYPASRARTPLAIVYIHGFSATKTEIRPVADDVAKALGANLFYTRLTGHGRDGAAMAQASVNDWLNDLAEAVAIGRSLGNRVVVIGTSTGGTLAAFGATRPELLDGVEGLVLLSPNFGLANRWSFLLEIPFARDLLPTLASETRSFAPVNEMQARHWTTEYPTSALLPLAALVRAARQADFSMLTLPVLALYAPDDAIVDADATRRTLARWGGPVEAHEVTETEDPARHVLAGDVLSPGTTKAIAERITAWIRALPDGQSR